MAICSRIVFGNLKGTASQDWPIPFRRCVMNNSTPIILRQKKSLVHMNFSWLLRGMKGIIWSPECAEGKRLQNSRSQNEPKELPWMPDHERTVGDSNATHALGEIDQFRGQVEDVAKPQEVLHCKRPAVSQSARIESPITYIKTSLLKYLVQFQFSLLTWPKLINNHIVFLLENYHV